MELIDFKDLAIAGVSLIPLVMGWVELSKKLGVKGNWSLVLSVLLGAVFAGLWQAMNTGLIPEAVIPWIKVAIVALGGGLAASGLYDVAQRGVDKITASIRANGNGCECK